MLCFTLLMPVLMLMALLGGALACGVRAVHRAAVRVPHLLAPRTEVVRHAQAREAWQQIIIHTPR